MIRPKNTTSRQRMGRDRLRRLRAFNVRLTHHVARALWVYLCVLSAVAPLVADPVVQSKRALSEPLHALKLITWGDPQGGERLSVSATRAEWLDEASALSLQGEVTLTKLSAHQGELVTLKCDQAHLTLSATPSSPKTPQLHAVDLKGGVTLTASQLHLRAARLRWVAGRPLELSGEVKGRWRGHSLEAKHVKVWPDEGRVEVSEVRALIQLRRTRSTLERARER